MDWKKEGQFDEFLDVDEYRLTRLAGGGVITSIVMTTQDLEVKLGQRVCSNGRFGALKGTLGIIVEIKVPRENGRTTDVIVVRFEGARSPTHMKFHELNLSQQGA